MNDCLVCVNGGWWLMWGNGGWGLMWANGGWLVGMGEWCGWWAMVRAKVWVNDG